MGNINQSVHLVGSHMADQHANSANLLIFSNGVQLILLAAFISTSQLWKKGGGEKKWKRVCYDSVLLHRVKQGNQSYVMNEVDTGASDSCCGGGGWAAGDG